MGLTLQTSPAMAGSVVEELRAAGVSYEDVKIALAHQEAQRRGGVPVLPLRVICGLDKPQARADRVMLDNTRALLMVPRRGGRPQGGLHITRRKIWANSVKTESPEEAEFYRPLSVPQRTRLYRAKRGLFKLAQKLAHEARQKTRVLTDHELLVAQFTQSCERVLRHLLWQERGRKGWLTPDYETIMEWTSLSRSTVYRTLNLLKEIGLIEWIRRFNYSSDSQSGARSEQTSNLYRLTLPVWLEKMLGMYTPLPADEEHRRQLALEDHAAMLAAVSPRERGRLLPDDAGIRADLANAALRLDQRARALPVARECHKNIAPLMNYIFSKNGEKESAWSADAYGPDGLGSA